jgi:hypothetical protein
MVIASIGILIVPSIQNVNAVPYLSPADLYKQSDIVFYGQVITKELGSGSDYYQVKVATYFKNPQSSDSITVASHTPDSPRAGYPQFEVGDKAIFYITQRNGINTISPFSQIAGNACDVHSFLGPALLPGEKLPISSPASSLRLIDADGNVIVGSIGTNHEIVLSYDDIWNNYPESRIIQVETSILDSNSQTVFYKKQNLEMQACGGPGMIKWGYVPTQSGNYTATVLVDNKTTISTLFEVKGDSGISSLKSTLSPLKQFKSGIRAKDVKCNDSFLILKAEDGLPACVTIETGKNLAIRGWATTFSTGHDYWTSCNTPYLQSDYGVPVLYMPTNSLGKLCVKYYSMNNPTTNVGINIFEANNTSQSATGITHWTYNSTLLQGNENTTISYFIKTGNTTGFYGVSISGCGGIPLAVGYDSNSTITTSDFPWAGHVIECPVITYDSQIDSTEGIGVRYIPYSGIP